MEPGSGKFSVKEAYKLANEWEEVGIWEGWRMIWRMKIMHRVKIFIWLMAHGNLLTKNSERRRRKMTNSPLCARCSHGDEGVMHAIRDCIHAREVWVRLLPSDLQTEFFSKDVQDWITWLLKPGKGMTRKANLTETKVNKISTIYKQSLL